MPSVPGQTMLFELLRSYTVLARTLNLSEAVEVLGSTRQTVRRHVGILEEIRGERLFEMKNRQYHLTEAGARSLKEAEAILERGEAWLAGYTEGDDGRVLVLNDEDGGPVFCAQKHQVSRLRIDKSPLLQCGLRCWANANAAIESPALAAIRPYLVVYRRHRDGWLCVEIGEKSSYASWFGWAWAKSNIGSFVKEMPAGTAYAKFISQAYQSVHDGQSVRLDHVHTLMPREKGGPLQPVSFQRLLLGCAFPDGEFALILLVDRTYNVSIAGLAEDRIRSMPEDLLMAFDPKAAEEQE
ncbi:LysR family transcriptional regulator [Pelagibius litoralis]|uniref:LysR family transcriptional regulator n=1 Tax=Pelagibius litoralis TaxID=374515 RepID=A0A967EXB3_9PROT|nr:LysR family transcriptional regulator [Pelagibius litoralis]NIA68660.1 LysR family transcriptional regulator [Pelagibius litoralis]